MRRTFDRKKQHVLAHQVLKLCSGTVDSCFTAFKLRAGRTHWESFSSMRLLRLRRLLLTGVSACVLALVMVQSAFADPRDFELNNNSPVDLAFVYVSPTATDNWGDDILGSGLLSAGNSVNVTFRAFDGNSCSYDIKVLGVGGEEGYLYKVDLCTVSHVTFS
jgi:hypothetical protein